MLYLVSIFSGCISYSETKVEKEFIIVSQDGFRDYQLIQDAINNASSYDSILVYEGIYYENIIVDKPLSIMGKNRDNTVIIGSHEYDVVQLTKDSIVISNFTIKSDKINTDLAGYLAGIYVSSDDNQIINCVIENCNVGINLEENNNNLIESCLLSNNSNGVYAVLSSNNSISFCTFEYNNAYGMYIYGGSDQTDIFDNSFDMNYIGLRIKSNHNEVKRNIFNENKGGLYVCCSANNNLVFHNSFYNNTDYQADGNYHANTWFKDEFLGGNYWGDYNGLDRNFDGFGDTSYIIASRNQSGMFEKIEDRYPLMFPKTPVTIE